MTLSVSVVVPLYNHEAYIASTLLAVFSQTSPAQEVIVIDDGSRDAGPEVVRQMQRSRPELIFWRHPNRGAHNTINLGVARSTCDLIAILNSDDIFEPRRLEVARRAFDADPDLDVVATGLSFIDGQGQPIPNAWFDEALGFYKSAGDTGLALVNGNFIMTTSNLVLRRRVFDEIGSFSNLRYAHDMDFLLRLVVEGRKMLFIDQPLLRYRMHATNTISEGDQKVKAEWAAVTAFYLSRLVMQEGGPGRLAAYMPILNRHTLTNSVMPLLAYFLKNPSPTLERNTYHRDTAMQKLVWDLVQ
jgi:glycosyltransferase involved in cell wall biosynthesis